MNRYKPNQTKFLVIGLLLLVLIGCDCSKKEGNDTHDALQGIVAVPFFQVQWEGDFWKSRLKNQKETLVPFALEKTAGALEALRLAGNYLNGDTNDIPKPHRYQSSDLYKVMEGAAYLLKEFPDTILEKRMDKIIDIIGDAQQEDGYLYVAHITGASRNHEPWGGGGMGDKPYSWVIHSHELYNIGHMYEAAVAYLLATGKDKWLKIAERSAQHINRVFFEGDPDYNNGRPINQAPGHQELELALIKLYQVSGNELYLNMAQNFLEIRGRTYIPEGEVYMSPEYSQQHLPVPNQRKAKGHAVRATYMYSAMADVDALLNSNSYDSALFNIWQDIVDKKMSITGGLGAVRGIEGFGPDYVLPNKEAHNETCAAVGNVLFNYRMFLKTGNAKYLDVAEVSLFNNVLAGVNFEGNKFFYVNPLEADGIYDFNHGSTGRSPWFNTACCPSNLARLIPQVSGMMYATDHESVYVNLYGSSYALFDYNKMPLEISQRSDYPHKGKVEITLQLDQPLDFKLKLRIPTWAGSNQFVPGGLYHYADKWPGTIQIFLNGEGRDIYMENGFAIFDRSWKNGDKVTIEFDMQPRNNIAVDQVEANRSKICITRGPLVYCAEEVDQESGVQQYYLNDIPAFVEVKSHEDTKLGNVFQVSIPAKRKDNAQESMLDLIPYYAWNNRGNGSMMVWIPVDNKTD